MNFLKKKKRYVEKGIEVLTTMIDYFHPSVRSSAVSSFGS